MNGANVVTLARIITIPFFLLALRLPDWTLATVVFCVIAGSDALDGWLARRRGASRAGAVLDPLADKLLIAAALIFLVGRGVDAWMAFVIIGREFIVTGLRVLSDRIIQASWWGKVKTISQMLAVVIVLLKLPYAWHAMLVATILTVISGADYVWKARSVLKKLL
ncbi:CDP-diacylglycerol--glycerol-3-phosphate 3-phosphatidyltransferase [Candidatus Woesearchaeota archaeon]|nr:CDP-diacylglycerol--glycerol-3-phosphate 3-phosphatidyltransferase [Candidatus Woesearchaeota archaeon]